MNRLRTFLAWVQKNERHLSAPVFVSGFIFDLFTVGRLSLSHAVVLYGSYVVAAALTTIGAHYLYVHSEHEGWFFRTLRTLLSLAAQFTTGGLLSGCLIFYTKSAALAASWPFVLLLIIIFIGNEAFRHYRERLAFRSVLFFFTLYAYAIFALPTVLKTLDIKTFIESTAVAVIGFLIFLLILAATGWKRLKSSLKEITIAVVFVAALVNVSYFTGIIPPLPLALRDAGVYHSVTHTSQGYEVTGEGDTYAWWDVAHIRSTIVHYTPGTPLSVYSAVFAPISLSTGIVHTWEWYDVSSHRWILKSEIAFPIQGGRDGGYRGYSTLSNLAAGRYRVSIETLSGQAIGRIYFNLENVTTEPVLYTVVK
ncbi:DUF2914 domain-containing protein [Patescibacteria group bacterium]|nr:DUF2914 domain-containing protein [Patescibacteria group bacterium]